MNRMKIMINGTIVIFCVAFVALLMWFLPDKALELLFVEVFSVVGSLLLLRGAKVDERKDERSMQLMTLGSRNAFMFLLFVMPAIATLNITGILVLNTAITLLILWIIAIAITWITFLYYYTR